MLRLTTSCAPQNALLQNSVGLPWGALITPLSPSPPPEDPAYALSPSFPTAESILSCAARTSSEIPRCTSCNAYVSTRCSLKPSFWTCSLCNTTNALPPRYASVLRSGGDAAALIPELSRSIYDVPVDEAAMPPAAYVFVLDITGDHAYLDTARDAIRRALDVIDGDTYVSVLLYDSHLHFLDLSAETPLIRRVKADDDTVEVGQVITASQWLSPTGPSAINSILNTLSRITAPSTSKDAAKPATRAMGPAMRAALHLLRQAECVASRVVLIAAGEPNFGDGAIELQSHSAAFTNTLPQPTAPLYGELGELASYLGCIVDMYVVSKAPVDVASICPLAQKSGGRLAMYESPDDALAQDIWQHLNDPAVVRGLLRVRTSAEFFIAEVYGSGVYRDVEVPDVYRLACHGHGSTLAVEFGFVEGKGFGKLQRRPCVQVAFQAVFVEPGSLPQPVIRVETHVLAVSASRNALRTEADTNAILTLMFHKAIATADEEGIGAARMLLFDFLATVLARTGGQTETVESGQGATNGVTVANGLQRYAALKKLPMLIFGLIRSFLFRQEAVAADTRAAVRCIWEDLSAELLAAAAYPRLYSFRNLDEKSGSEIGLSWAEVVACGQRVFLLDAFSEVIVYYNDRDGVLTYPPPEDCGVMKVREERLRDRPISPRCIVCREGTPKDRWFKALLIEDAAGGAQSFAKFMQGVLDAAQEVGQKEAKTR